MSEGLNKVMLLGNLCADPELRHTQGGQGVLNIRLATNESYLDKDKNRVDKTEYHNVTVWGKRGEGLAKILVKGSSIFVEGSLRTSSYEDKDGNKRYKTEINATNVILAGGKRGGGSDDDGGGDAPQEQSRGGGDGGGQRAQGKPSGGSYGRQGGGGGGNGGGQSQGAPAQKQQQRQAAPPAADPYAGYDNGSGDDQIPF